MSLSQLRVLLIVCLLRQAIIHASPTTIRQQSCLFVVFPLHGNKQNNGQDNPGKSDKSFKNSKDVGNDVDARVSFDHARHLALNYGLTGYDSLPPGIAKNLARGKPLPPGIAKKTVPASMLGQLPSYPGYEWRVVGDDLVLIALSTAIVTSVINGVFK